MKFKPLQDGEIETKLFLFILVLTFLCVIFPTWVIGGFVVRLLQGVK